MYKDSLGWSISRATLLHYCSKKYFFNYYTRYLRTFEWEFYQECLIIKNLSSLKMRIGQVGHGIMSDYLNLLQKGNVSDEGIASLKKTTLEEMDKIYQKAKKKDFHNYDKNDKFGFSEHFYEEDIDEAFEQEKQKLIESFDGFLGSQTHKDIKKYFVPGNKVFVESKIPDFGQMQYTIENIPELKGITLWAQPDLGIIVPSQTKGEKTKYIIYDRKTGRVPEKKEDEISEQLKVYAYKMLLKIGLDKFDDVEIWCHEVFLKNMAVFGGQIKWEDIYNIQQKIVLDVTYQKKFLQNQDPEKNNPLDTQYFPRTDNQNKCKTCRFRKVCGELTNYEEAIQQQSLF